MKGFAAATGGELCPVITDLKYHFSDRPLKYSESGMLAKAVCNYNANLKNYGMPAVLLFLGFYQGAN